MRANSSRSLAGSFGRVKGGGLREKGKNWGEIKFVNELGSGQKVLGRGLFMFNRRKGCGKVFGRINGIYREKGEGKEEEGSG